PANNLKELIAYAKGNPGKLSYGSAGFGTSGHLAGELFVYLTKTDITHVPYKGNSEAVTDLLGGRIQMMFSGPPPVLAFVAAGKLRAIAAADYKRSAALPDVPTMAEQGLADAESPAWYGIMAPIGVPASILDRLNAEVHKAMARPEVQAKFAQLGINAQPNSRAEFRQMITDETAKWKKLFAGRSIAID
ncbi:MAG: tripartite tricarboxylate transporter substrate binding protein, partial [Oxalobacteraceae bacterium]